MTTEARADTIGLADTLSDAELDLLPVGTILLDGEGTILRYNETEASLSRHAREEVLGKNFFRDVAPCTRVREFQGRFEEGVAAGELDVTFGYRFRFPDDRIKDVTVSMRYQPESGNVWVLVERP
jgi:photoactive yellow protein